MITLTDETVSKLGVVSGLYRLGEWNEVTEATGNVETREMVKRPATPGEGFGSGPVMGKQTVS